MRSWPNYVKVKGIWARVHAQRLTWPFLVAGSTLDTAVSRGRLIPYGANSLCCWGSNLLLVIFGQAYLWFLGLGVQYSVCYAGSIFSSDAVGRPRDRVNMVGEIRVNPLSDKILKVEFYLHLPALFSASLIC